MNAGAAGRSDLVLKALSQGKSQVSGELLVQFSAQSSSTDRNAVRQALGVTQRSVVRTAKGTSLELMKLPLGTQIADAARGLDGVAGVDFVEPNWTCQQSDVSDDTYFTNGTLCCRNHVDRRARQLFAVRRDKR
ncbi:MAG: hypothetical protein IPK97_20610 [Ahniella sp.]|nr:hypothetical protein [Ahniella sp.]